MAINSILPQSIFDLLGIWNGPWTTLTVNPLSATINGTDPGDPNNPTGNDSITISTLNVLVFGNGGNDKIDSSTVGLVNVLNGGGGSDQIFGGTGVNTINGGPGDDYIHGGGGADILDGGTGDNDTLSYELAQPVRNTQTGVTVTLNALGGGIVSGGSNVGVDVISGGFEHVVGSNFNDTLTGNGGNNILIGLGGNDLLFGLQGDDRLIGGAGADVFTGGAGIDTADYSTSPGAIQVDLSMGTGSGNDAAGDILSAIENVTGSALNDAITGDVGNNVLAGLAGDDTLNGNFGNDTLIGGPGNNTMNGGPGDDIFVLDTVRDNGEDKIFGFHLGGDKIDLRLIDANSLLAGIQSFTLSFSGTLGPAGVLTVVPYPMEGTTYIAGNIDADTVAEVLIQVHSPFPLSAADFIL